ncbi:PREDICTED: putative pentatricopeptide repeat-containing protein At5g59200, chloroplastic [Populus euphratica]|uniref:Pentatricopeptide repeat-containing protein At5g59200, chloroplastic n=1 Tax=Populus euphratica TaxID=75702 RepID=A0AAJ6TQ01_POPEU|nr:PREDICTED: putative pentatricopeptide repeat-containing protein At5g59200, chloroplastic [Populus euphratica]
MNHSSSMLSSVAGCSALPPNLGTKPKNTPNRRRHFISLLQNCKHNNQIPPIHAKIIRNHRHQDPFVVFELLRVCSNLNSIGYASKIFSQTQNPNVYLYTALIDGLVLSCYYTDGIHLYYQMINSSLVPDSYAVTSVLKACGCHLALKEGREVHSQVLKLGLSSNRSIRIKLIERYGKGGAFEDARQVFDEMPERDVVASTVMINYYFDHGLVNEATSVFSLIRIKDTVCWTAMIDGLVRNGESNRALEVFRNMQREDVMPNEVTIVCVLSACSELGALQLGRWVHSYMDKHGIELNQFVGGALINMYSRCGDIDEAQRVFEQMKEKNTYILLSNAYSSSGKWKEAAEVRTNMREEGIEKEPGCSSIEVNNEIHEFLLGDLRHPQKEKIYKKLEELNEILRLEGYTPATEVVLHDIEKSEKEWALAIHSERLAICYGLISTKPLTTIRVVKNLRVCDDCHLTIKLISNITRRKIVVRDRNRFHHFENGVCSCGDYW